MDIALHPQFAQNGFVYLTYTKPIDAQKRVAALARGKWDGQAITGMKDIFVTDVAGGTSRIAFGRDGSLFMSLTGNDPQDANTLGGKVLRLRDDGTVPPDNPFVGQPARDPKFTRWVIAARWVWRCIREPAKCGRTRMVPMAAMRSTF
jgi:glucose/arabinose dehydrogenase